MCKAMEDMRNRAVFDARKQFAVDLYLEGDRDIDKIAKLSRLPIETVAEIIAGTPKTVSYN